MNDLEEKLGKTKSTIEHELQIITQELTARPNLPTWKIMVCKHVDDKIHEVNDNLSEFNEDRHLTCVISSDSTYLRSKPVLTKLRK